MNTVPIIKSKLIMPQLPQSMIVSERIERLAKDISSRQVVVITAPAGYGKSTLAAYALHKFGINGCKIRWYRLDEEDTDLSFFYLYLVEMLFPEEDGLWTEIRGYFAEYGDIYNQYEYLNALLCQEWWAYHNRFPNETTYMVFDDYQEIINCPEIVNTIQYLIDNLPDSCRILINSRSDSLIFTPKRSLDKDIIEITSDDLSLTKEELASLIKARTGTDPDPALLNKILLQTEGWLAGAILFCQLLGNADGSLSPSMLDVSERKEFLFEYIAQEVIQTIDLKLLHFLLKLAILKDWTIDQAISIFDEPNVSRLQAECEQKELFIQKISGQVTTYRFHALFRETLLRIQPEYLTHEEINKFHLNAAAYYIKNRIFARAIEHFILCGNVQAAVELVTAESAEMMALEATAELTHWLSLLPEEVIYKNSYLLFLKGYSFYPSRLDQSRFWFERALTMFEKTQDVVMQLNTLNALICNYIQRNDIEGMELIFSKVQVLETNHPQDDLSHKYKILFLGQALWEENFSGKEDTIRNVVETPTNDDWQWLTFAYPLHIYYLLGNLGLAQKCSDEMMKLAISQNARLVKGFSLTFYATLKQLKDEQDNLYQHIQDIIDIGQKIDYSYFGGFGHHLAALYHYRNHELEFALESIETSTNYFENLGNVPMAISTKLLHCLWLCRQGNHVEQLVEAKRLVKLLTARPAGLGLQEIGVCIFGAIALEAGDYILAEKNLKAAVQRSKRKGFKQVLTGSYLHLAQLYYRLGDPSRGKRFLRIALESAEDNQYVTFPNLYFPTLVEMAAQCIKNDIHSDYAKALICRFFGNAAAEFLADNAILSTDENIKHLTDTFMEEYGNKNETKKPRISIILLGRFCIAVDGVSIPDSEWKTKKISGIFKYLVMHRGQPVFREQLMGVFWPDVDKNLAQMSLRAALYELKKVFRKYGAEDESGISFLTEKRDRLQVHTGNLLTVDVDTFWDYYSDLNKINKTKNPMHKKVILEKMVSIYKGDLLESDAYEDWLFAAREELKSIYLKIATELASIYEGDGTRDKAEKLLFEVLTNDPYNEEACFCLLKIYCANNQRARAAKLCSVFSERFTKDLGIIPDERLSVIIQEAGIHVL